MNRMTVNIEMVMYYRCSKVIDSKLQQDESLIFTLYGLTEAT